MKILVSFLCGLIIGYCLQQVIVAKSGFGLSHKEKYLGKIELNVKYPVGVSYDLKNPACYSIENKK